MLNTDLFIVLGIFCIKLDNFNIVFRNIRQFKSKMRIIIAKYFNSKFAFFIWFLRMQIWLIQKKPILANTDFYFINIIKKFNIIFFIYIFLYILICIDFINLSLYYSYNEFIFEVVWFFEFVKLYVK